MSKDEKLGTCEYFPRPHTYDPMTCKNWREQPAPGEPSLEQPSQYDAPDLSQGHFATAHPEGGEKPLVCPDCKSANLANAPWMCSNKFHEPSSPPAYTEEERLRTCGCGNISTDWRQAQIHRQTCSYMNAKPVSPEPSSSPAPADDRHTRIAKRIAENWTLTTQTYSRQWVTEKIADILAEEWPSAPAGTDIVQPALNALDLECLRGLAAKIAARIAEIEPSAPAGEAREFRVRHSNSVWTDESVEAFASQKVRQLADELEELTQFHNMRATEILDLQSQLAQLRQERDELLKQKGEAWASMRKSAMSDLSQVNAEREARARAEAELANEKLFADAQRRGLEKASCGHLVKYEIQRLPGEVGCLDCNLERAEGELREWVPVIEELVRLVDQKYLLSEWLAGVKERLAALKSSQEEGKL